MFFHRYFVQKNEKEKAKADKISKRRGGDALDSGEEDALADGYNKRGEAGVDEEEEEDEEAEEAEIWKVWNSLPC